MIYVSHALIAWTKFTWAFNLVRNVTVAPEKTNKSPYLSQEQQQQQAKKDKRFCLVHCQSRRQKHRWISLIGFCNFFAWFLPSLFCFDFNSSSQHHTTARFKSQQYAFAVERPSYSSWLFFYVPLHFKLLTLCTVVVRAEWWNIFDKFVMAFLFSISVGFRSKILFAVDTYSRQRFNSLDWRYQVLRIGQCWKKLARNPSSKNSQNARLKQRRSKCEKLAKSPQRISTWSKPFVTHGFIHVQQHFAKIWMCHANCCKHKFQ